MNGFVNASLEAVFTLYVSAPGQPKRPVEAILDTGFDGAIAMPDYLVKAFGLPFYKAD